MASIIRRSVRGIRLGLKVYSNTRLLSSRKTDDYLEADPQFSSGKNVEVQIMNQDDEGMFVDAYSNIGFRLNSGIRVIGPCAMFPKSVLHWNISGIKDVHEKSLSLFTKLEPKLDLLILGVGERENLGRINIDIIRFLRSNRINVEILPTDQALATFNFLNAEKRFVAGAFIPPNYIEDFSDDEDERYEIIESQMGQKIHEIDDMFLPVKGDKKDVKEIQKIFKETRQYIKDKIYQTEDREKDKKENPWKYRE